MEKITIDQIIRDAIREEIRSLVAEIREEEDRKREEEQELQPVPFVADFLHVNEQTVRNMIARGNIREVRVGRRVLCDMTQLRKDVDAGKVGRGKHTKQRR